MVKVRWTFQAIEDINNIADFISKDSFKYSQIQVELFFDAALVLEKHLLSGRVVPETSNSNLRELVLGNYRIIYKVLSVRSIDILTVHHSARLLNKASLSKK